MRASHPLCIRTSNLYDGDRKQSPHRPRTTDVLPNVIAKDSDHA